MYSFVTLIMEKIIENDRGIRMGNYIEFYAIPFPNFLFILELEILD